MVLGRAKRYSWDLVFILSLLPSFLALTIPGFVPPSPVAFAIEERKSLVGVSTRCYEAMTGTEECAPVLLISRLEQYSMGEDAKANLVLASQSPRRREILDMMNLKGRYSVETSPLDETEMQQELSRSIGMTPVEYTQKLAEAKAFSLADKHRTDGKSKKLIPTFYLGSDTIVELDDHVLEKPSNPEDAKRMLTMLSGRKHHVHTGVALYRLVAEDITLVASLTDTATVTFSGLSQETIDAYVATGEPLDKAGTSNLQ